MDVMAGATAAECLARARGLIPLLRAEAPAIEAARGLTPRVLDAMHGAGMFRLLLPRAYGGAQLRPSDYVRCVEAIAEGDASAAWCMGQGSGCSMASAYMPPAVAHELFDDPRGVLAWGQGPGARLVRAPGGWRVTGSWSFVSGARHATWFGANGPCFEADGTPIVRPDGRAWDRTLLVPRASARIEDVWRVVGLRGTGSDTVHVDDLFVDDAHAFTRDYAPGRVVSEPLYRFQSMQLYAGGFACVALGTARAAVDAFADLVRTKTRAWAADAMAGDAAVLRELAYRDAALKAAKAGLLEVLDDAWDEVAAGADLSVAHRVAVRQAATFAIHAARDAANAVYHEAGSTAIFDAQPFERRFRDVNAVSQQLQGRRAHFETVGRYLVGGQPDMRWL